MQKVIKQRDSYEALAYILDGYTSVKCTHTYKTRNRMWNTNMYATCGLVLSMVNKVGLR